MNLSQDQINCILLLKERAERLELFFYYILFWEIRGSFYYENLALISERRDPSINFVLKQVLMLKILLSKKKAFSSGFENFVKVFRSITNTVELIIPKKDLNKHREIMGKLNESLKPYSPALYKKVLYIIKNIRLINDVEFYKYFNSDHYYDIDDLLNIFDFESKKLIYGLRNGFLEEICDQYSFSEALVPVIENYKKNIEEYEKNNII